MEPLHVAVAAFSFFAPHNSQSVETEPAQQIDITERVIRVGEGVFRAIARTSGLISLASFMAVEAVAYVKEENLQCPFVGPSAILSIVSIASGTLGLLSLGAATLFNAYGESRGHEREFLIEEQRVKKALQLRRELKDLKKGGEQDALELVPAVPKELSAQQDIEDGKIQKNNMSPNPIKVNLRAPSRAESVVSASENILFGAAKIIGGAAALGLTALQINQTRIASCGWEKILDPISLTCVGLGVSGSISYGLSFLLGAARKYLQTSRLSEALQADKNV